MDEGEPPGSEDPPAAGPGDRPDDEAPRTDAEETPAEDDRFRPPLEPGSPSLEHAAFVLLGMATALVVWLLLLP